MHRIYPPKGQGELEAGDKRAIVTSGRTIYSPLSLEGWAEKEWK